MVTIKEVAKMAGVAVSTASNAINGKYGVKLETKRRVLDAAKALNYVPNPIAQGLVTNSMRNVSIILSGPADLNFFTNPIFWDVTKSITSTISENGYHALLNIIDTEEEDEVIPRIAQSRTTDALILVGSRKKDCELAALLGTISIPSLVAVGSAPSENFLAVSVNNWKCGYMATQYLLEMGHRNIGFIGAYPGNRTLDQRLAGYRQALEDAGIKYDSTLAVEGNLSQESGRIGIRKLLKKRPTAVTAANDLMALGALEVLIEEGIRVPEDMSIIGCDNIPNLHLLKVPLTTCAIPFEEIGRLSALKIIGLLEENDSLPAQIILDPELRIRKSVRHLGALSQG